MKKPVHSHPRSARFSRACATAVAGIAALAMNTAMAALKVGDSAPDFTTPAAIGGKAFTFSLADALKKGPVVLYFYPKAFTPGCTVEAHNFAEATEKFAALGATLVGMSGDNIDTLKEFSVKECRNKFAVAADADGKIMKKYDARPDLVRDQPGGQGHLHLLEHEPGQPRGEHAQGGAGPARQTALAPHSRHGACTRKRAPVPRTKRKGPASGAFSGAR